MTSSQSWNGCELHGRHFGSWGEFWSKPFTKKPGSISYNHASLFNLSLSKREIDDSGNALSVLSDLVNYDVIMTSMSTRNIFQTATRLSASWKIILIQLVQSVSACHKFAGTLFWDARRSIPASSWMLQICWTSGLQILDSSSIFEILAVLQMSFSKYSLNTWIAQNSYRLKILEDAKHAHLNAFKSMSVCACTKKTWPEVSCLMRNPDSPVGQTRSWSTGEPCNCFTGMIDFGTSKVYLNKKGPTKSTRL